MARLKPFYIVQEDRWRIQDADAARDFKDTLEPIRQWLISELVDTYNYPSQWIGSRIVPLRGAENDLDTIPAIGFSILTQDNVPFLMALAASPAEAESADKFLRAVIIQNSFAGTGIVTDGTEAGTRFLRRRYDSEHFDYIPDIETYSMPSSVSGSPLCIFKTTNESGAARSSRRERPLNERVENLFFDLHSSIRDIDGLHADEALDEICKVLYTKMYDEEATQENKPYRMQRWLYGSTEEFAVAVRHLYSEANAYDVRVFSLKIPGYVRSRGVFNAPVRLSNAALAKVVESLQEYNITASETDIKGRAFQKVFAPAIRAGMGQYFTPSAVARFMVQVAQPSHADLILDPFCGSAHFLSACLHHVGRTEHSLTQKQWHEFAFGKLHGIEKSDRMVRVAMTDMRLQGDGHSNIRCTDALLDFVNYPDLHPASFDLILTNPPFGSVVKTAALASLGMFTLGQERKSVPLEVLGLERCLQFLRPGGRLAIVLPDGLLANRSSGYVRSWLEQHLDLLAIVSLPIETFAPFGASVKTSILFGRKWQSGEKRENTSVYLARVDNVGHDTTGRARMGAELEALGEELSSYASERGW